ncbi:TlpA family protein disulfide reductase [Tenacibaculum sp. Mcav3-52]|uniref:TlpA family protein disulfide reductase n=1 Tax=Tenacibaculum sp. Mcav3-52 TaxID=2917762 RepID=UPI001EF31EA1|nr:TlpA disulfide reductase family protein [Tenacibaculum sp. Mcav3-52]MCG7503221.1 TlpA family protein disulfide reductase [Tenacibaculum sp. Mcav3-52]
MTLRKFISLILFTLLLFSCTSKKDNEVPKLKNELIVCIENYSDNQIALRKEASYQNINKSLYTSKKKIDTINIKLNKGEFIYLSHKKIVPDTLFLGKGDSIKIKAYEDRIEYIVNSYNQNNKRFKEVSQKLKQDSIYQSFKKQIDSLTNIFYSIKHNKRPMIGNNDYQKFVSYPVKVNEELYPSKHKEEKLLIDLLDKLYLYKIDFFKKQELPNDLKVHLNFKSLIEYNNKLSVFHSFFKSKAAKDKLNSAIFINDSLLLNPYSKTLMLSFLRKNVIKSKPTYTRSRQYINYVEAFDNAPLYFNDSLTKYARFLSIEAMINFGESFNVTRSKFNEFKNKYQDDRLNTILEDKYLLDIDIFDNIKNDVKLINHNQEISSLNDLIKNNNGNYIFIDFWASWCFPCRESMPDYQKVIHKFSKEKITFLYLSIDKNKDSWLSAVKTENMESYQHSYMVLNQESANFLKSIKLVNIPRYILLDKQGKILHENAPGPKGDELTVFLNKYLSK